MNSRSKDVSFEDSPPVVEPLDGMMERLRWMEERSNLAWPVREGDSVGKVAAYALDARFYASVVADDVGDHEQAREIRSVVLQSEVDWSNGDVTAWFSAGRIANQVARDLGRMAVGDLSTSYSVEERRAFSRKCKEVSVPLLDQLLAHEPATRSIGEDRVLVRWGRAHSIAAWAQRRHDPQHAFDILRRVVREIERCPGIGPIREAVFFAVESVLAPVPGEGSTEAGLPDVGELWSIAKPAYQLPFESDGDDDWLVSAVGSLGHLIPSMPEEASGEARELMLGLFDRWTERCFSDRNVGWAMHYLLPSATASSDGTNRYEFGDDDRRVLDRVVASNRVGLLDRIVQLPGLVEAYAEMIGSEDRERLRGRLRSRISETMEAKAVPRYVACLASLSEGEGVASILESWSAPQQGSPFVRLVWLKSFGLRSLLAESAETLLAHLRGLIDWKSASGRETVREIEECWLDGFTWVASVVLVLEDADLMDEVIREVEPDGMGDPAAWCSVVTVLASGQGRERASRVREWASRALEVCDPETLGPEALARCFPLLTTLAREVAVEDPALADALFEHFESLRTVSAHRMDEEAS